jgi:RNA polymerase sigma factor for flagellar operon FliA
MYVTNPEIESEDLVSKHAALVKRIAYHLMSRLPPSVQADDLIQAGMIGLLEASRNYDASQGASFETYAGIRIRGAMLEIENQYGRDARDIEVAEKLGIDLNEYHRILQDATGCRVFSIDDAGVNGDDAPQPVADAPRNEPLDRLHNEDFKSALAEAISNLPERERLVMAMYYDEELNLREIGEVLGVSESRVCQIHGQALIRLRARMTEWTGD